MKGFVCDRCGETESGLPSDRLPGGFQLEDMSQFVFIKIELVGSLPAPDLCDDCKRQLAAMALKAAEK